MKVMSVSVIRGEDWEGVYHYGKLIAQGNQIDWVRLLKKNVITVNELLYVDDDWLKVQGILPEKQSDVLLDHRVHKIPS